ncbi:MAG: lysophospholipid acyltransferase family protein [Gammaproteobacteria bacterium]
MLNKIIAVIYGVYTWTVFLLVVVTTTLLVAITPGLGVRRAMARAAARLIFASTGMPLRVTTIGQLPDSACVIVSNHASFLDGVILTGALPPRFAFVIKNEMQNAPIAGLLLRRLGSEFVERSDRHKGASDARRIMRKAHEGEALVFFPEGTFRTDPGLGRFHSGAFAAAERANLPVVPVVIKGSRHVLPANRKLPRPGPIDVVITGPLDFDANHAEQSVSGVTEAARQRILEHLEEPSLDIFIRPDRTE